MEIQIAKDSQDDGQPSEMELKSMAETLQEAAEIKADPELMKLLKPYLDKKVRSLDDLKALSKEKADEESAESPDAEASEQEVE